MFKCSVKYRIRSVIIATCTSGEPVSFAWVWYLPTSPDRVSLSSGTPSSHLPSSLLSVFLICRTLPEGRPIEHQDAHPLSWRNERCGLRNPHERVRFGHGGDEVRCLLAGETD